VLHALHQTPGLPPPVRDNHRFTLAVPAKLAEQEWSRNHWIAPHITQECTVNSLAGWGIGSRAFSEKVPYQQAQNALDAHHLENDDRVGRRNTQIERALIRSVHDPG
jgi:hypothetical protein